MDRRKFVKLTTVTSAGLILASTNILDAKRIEKKSKSQNLKMRDLDKDDFAEISPSLESGFVNLLKWLNENGWLDLLHDVTGVNVDITNPYDSLLYKRITVNENILGFDDFGGFRIIEPGMPSMSLLYHLLASPRVKLNNANGTNEDYYSDLEQIDLLENFIYGIKKISQEEKDADNYVLAVLAYEYRPAFKTPHGVYADLVFSRTGIGRVGEKAPNYDKINRCYTNKPSNPTEEKNIAVAPARYGLFLSKIVAYSDIALMATENDRGGGDKIHNFILPVRKIFNDEKILDGGKIVFSEYHTNVQLNKLANPDTSDNNGKQWEVEFTDKFSIQELQQPPFTKISCSTLDKTLGVHNSNLVNLIPKGGSILLSSIPAPLVRLVRHPIQPKKYLSCKIPKKWHWFLSPALSNRRYSSLKLLNMYGSDTWDFIVTSSIFKGKKYTRYTAPRNSPIFINIRNIMDPLGESSTPISIDMDDLAFYEQIDAPNTVPLFEDNICDGCISAGIDVNNDLINKVTFSFTTYLKNRPFYPAFSIVTAPDFFPYVDSNDISTYDIFFNEGGTENLSSGRLYANQTLPIPETTELGFDAPLKAFPIVKDEIKEVPIMERESHSRLLKINIHNLSGIDYGSQEKQPYYPSVCLTITAVLSPTPPKKYRKKEKFRFSYKRDYKATSFLPDTASNIFAPGWDVTYSGKKKNSYFSTVGLGLPFPEDMKLCAAANGMWPVASPDASRTFQGSLDPIGGIFANSGTKPSTSIPLMDDEIGIHQDSPYYEYNLKDCIRLGWDGEQGPFLENIDNKYVVNSTDIGRADYVDNALNSRFDMSKLRNLDCSELISRMDCLGLCIRKIGESKTVGKSKLWLVSAEKADWSIGANGYGIPKNLCGSDNSWATVSNLSRNKEGYLYVFSLIKNYYTNKGVLIGKRRRQDCDKIYVCQVTDENIAWCVIPGVGLKSGYKIEWNS